MKLKFILIAIILLGAFFRFYGLYWDQTMHLHPDERFLSMVSNDMRLPNSFFTYLNPQLSTFNPPNFGFDFFVYGMLPLTFNKILAIFFSTDNYFDLTIQGRILSGFFDLLIVLLIFKSVELFEKAYKFDGKIKYWGAFLYATAVLPIQLSHFFLVDTFLNFFLFASFYTMLLFYFKGKVPYLLLSAVFLGCAFATKVTSFFLLPLLLFFFFSFFWKKHSQKKHDKLIHAFILLFVFGYLCYFIARVTDPYLFANSNFFDLRISPHWIENLKKLQSYAKVDTWALPPSVQWIHKTPVLFSLKNIIVFGVGIPFFICLLVGVISFIKKHLTFTLICIWMLLYFLYQSIQVSQPMRYFLPLYPFFAIIAAFGITTLTNKWKQHFLIIPILILLIWPLMFFSIYTKPHSRIVATKWIQDNISNDHIILGEHWDDALPIGGIAGNGPEKKYSIELLPVFGPDTPEKWTEMDQLLAKGDYLILSSNRGWGSIPTASERYPRMTKFYEDLFAGKLEFKQIKEFSSYPSLAYLGIPLTLPDQWADESFTVYDHPLVMIFEKKK